MILRLQVRHAPVIVAITYSVCNYSTMTIQQGILAILSLGEAHGYQIRAELASRAGQAWELNLGQIYQSLARLQRDGLIEQSSNNEDRQTYRITTSGQTQVSRWLNEATERGLSNRDELILKLSLAVTLPGVKVTDLLDAQRSSNLNTLQLLTTAKAAIDRDDPKELSWLLILENQIFSLEAELRWLDHVAVVLEKAADRGLSPKVSISNNPPRRGRPRVKSQGGR